MTTNQQQEENGARDAGAGAGMIAAKPRERERAAAQKENALHPGGAQHAAGVGGNTGTEKASGATGSGSYQQP